MSILTRSPSDRLAKLQAQLAEAQLAADNALADFEKLKDSEAGDDPEALRNAQRIVDERRDAVEALNQRCAAVQQLVDAEERAAQEKRRAEEVRKLHEERIALARKVDAAAKAFGEATREFFATPGGSRNLRAAFEGALSLHAVEMLRTLHVQPADLAFRFSLEQHEANRLPDPNVVGGLRIEPAPEPVEEVES